ncbi:hypothetical protein [Limnohabitans sp. T6-20]|nr:hypothetical protein [Limnohabitans sp. T6-20]
MISIPAQQTSRLQGLTAAQTLDDGHRNSGKVRAMVSPHTDPEDPSRKT